MRTKTPSGADSSNENPSDSLDYDEAARLLGLCVGTLYALVSRRQLPHFRLGPRIVRFSRKRLIEWRESRAVVVGSNEKVGEP